MSALPSISDIDLLRYGESIIDFDPEIAHGAFTAGYSHGYPLELKRTLLCKWADHVERLGRGLINTQP